MSLEITSLSARYRVTPQGNLWEQDVPFIAVNATFRIEDDPCLLERTKADAAEYRQVLTIASPEDYEGALNNWDLTFKNGYEFGKAWTHNDPSFQYLEKFNTFHFREWVADSTVTRAILSELQHYKEHGSLPSVYRHAEEHIIVSHFCSLERYWD